MDEVAVKELGKEKRRAKKLRMIKTVELLDQINAKGCGAFCLCDLCNEIKLLNGASYKKEKMKKRLFYSVLMINELTNAREKHANLASASKALGKTEGYLANRLRTKHEAGKQTRCFQENGYKVYITKNND